MLKGIDVSHWQGDIDWNAVRQAGIEFAFIKATEDIAFKDSRFYRNWAESKRVGIIHGAYHFFRPKANLQGQIDNFLNSVPALEHGDLPPVLDLEVAEQWTGLSVAARMDLVLGWLHSVRESLDITPIIYTSPYFANSILRNDARLAEFPLWIAHWSNGTRPILPKPWTKYTFWQHTNQGAVPGISGRVDLDRFNGTIEELRALAKRPPVDPCAGR